MGSSCSHSLDEERAVAHSTADMNVQGSKGQSTRKTSKVAGDASAYDEEDHQDSPDADVGTPIHDKSGTKRSQSSDFSAMVKRRMSVSAEVLEAANAAHGGHGTQTRGSIAEDEEEEEEGAPEEVVPKSAATKSLILRAIKSCILFQGMDRDQLLLVVDAMKPMAVAKEQVIIEQGSDGEHFYVIETGIYRATVDGKPALLYENTGSFGELSLMYHCPRAATITALSDGHLWVMDRAAFQRIIVGAAQNARSIQESIIDSMDIFKVLSATQKRTIADCLEKEIFYKGDVIMAQGDPLGPHAKFYIVYKGKVGCYRSANPGGGAALPAATPDGGKPGTTSGTHKVLVKQVEEGGFFGELALLEHEPRQADVIAESDELKLLSMQRDAFERLMGPAEEIFRATTDEYKKINAGLGALTLQTAATAV
eukprot:jgi/Mesvir1/21807/Mv04197-RA.1